jgi:alpha-tubulin suppressor-like RCC1 family protein
VCWGGNGRGQLGAPLDVSGPDPVLVDARSEAVAVACGAAHTCARTTDDVLCWGDQQYGQLGNPDTATPSPLPVRVVGLGEVTAVAAGDRHTCAIAAGQALHCWGDGALGRLGLGTEEDQPIPKLDTPVAVPCSAPKSRSQNVQVVIRSSPSPSPSPSPNRRGAGPSR